LIGFGLGGRTMTELLKQDAIESDERAWDADFAAAPDKLKRLADRAFEDFRAGRTEPLDPEKL
jgi:hypothetical protein